MWYVGVDVHLKSSSVCVLDEHGCRIDQKKIRGPWPMLVAWLKDRAEPISVCYEASCGYGPLYEAMSQFAVHVEVAHPGHLRLIFRSKKKNDRADAERRRYVETLAYLLQPNIRHAKLRCDCSHGARPDTVVQILTRQDDDFTVPFLHGIPPIRPCTYLLRTGPITPAEPKESRPGGFARSFICRLLQQVGIRRVVYAQALG